VTQRPPFTVFRAALEAAGFRPSRRLGQNFLLDENMVRAIVRDAQIGRALALLHGEPGRAWTVDELAREVALSRSALAERFAALVGEPPIQYLMRWRLALAATALRSGNRAIARVAEESGYESESAFNRAFKREFGMPPAAWRRQGTGNPSGAGSSP